MGESNFLLTLPGNGPTNIYWRRLSMDDLEIMENMMCDDFRKHEPLCATVGLTRGDALSGLAPYCKAQMADGNSICAYDPNTDRVCGMSINSGPHTVQKPTNKWLEETTVNESMTKVFAVLELLGGGPEKTLATRAGNAKFMKCDVLAVHEDYARMGIGEALCKKSWEIAKEEGCELVFVECTSTFTKQIFKKHGAETLKEVVYSEYTDPISGKKVFENCPEPHKIGTFMCKKL